ncbi:MAG: pyridoxamine 5'-phosphate oxidase family protein [Maribacter sp.]|nr:pyridoxamine 5'-phosphate oxidase family protein [Maribacter sp.]
MPDKIFEKIKTELKKGALKKGHYFKYFTLATLGVDKFARLRLVALRNVSDDLKMTFFTDKRSRKVLHIKEDNRVSMLFYHHKKLIQLRIEGVARINTDQFQIQKTWDQVDTEARKDFITKEAPGSILEDPNALEFLEEGDYFSIVEIDPFRIEYLKLKKDGHTKIKYSRIDNGWSSEYLVP